MAHTAEKFFNKHGITSHQAIRKIVHRVSTLLLCSAFSTNSIAHTQGYTHIKNSVDAGASITLRSNEMLEDDQLYLIPGTLMGGEAYPYEKGLGIDDAYLAGGFSWSEHLLLSGELSAHEHESSVELELETLALSYRPKLESEWYVTAGKFASRISPSASWHANPHSFTEAGLQSDLHFGRHGYDNGIRISYEPMAWQVGLELWNGQNWPASSRQGQYNFYGFINGELGKSHYRLGAWFGRSEAENRVDQRFSQGHSHSGGSADTNISEYEFTGDIDGFGAYFMGEFPLNDKHSLFLDLEFVSQTHQGDLSRNNQNTEIEYAPETYRVSLAWQAGEHKFIAQQERTIITNEIGNSVDAIFLSESNLENNDHEPSRFTMAWHWRLNSNLVSKVEWVRENLIDKDETQSRFNINLTMAFDLLSQF